MDLKNQENLINKLTKIQYGNIQTDKPVHRQGDEPEAHTPPVVDEALRQPRERAQQDPKAMTKARETTDGQYTQPEPDMTPVTPEKN